MNTHYFIPLLAIGAAGLPPASARLLPATSETVRTTTYQQAQGLAAFFRDQGELLDYDPMGSAVTVNDCLAEFAADWRVAADSAIDSVRACADMLGDAQAPTTKVQLWRRFVNLAVALDDIANDLADGSADHATAYFDAADAYTDFGTLLPTVHAVFGAATPVFDNAAAAMESLALHVQSVASGTAGVAFLDTLMAFHETQAAIAEVLFDLTDDFAAPSDESATTHGTLAVAQIIATTETVLGTSPWVAYGIGYQVGADFDAETTLWIREVLVLRTTATKQVSAGYASAWHRFLGTDGVVFSTATTTTSDTLVSLSSDPTVGTLP